MTAIRPPVPLPDPFEVVFEQPLWEFYDTFRMARCDGCPFQAGAVYGVACLPRHHWCERGERILVIWEAA